MGDKTIFIVMKREQFLLEQNWVLIQKTSSGFAIRPLIIVKKKKKELLPSYLQGEQGTRGEGEGRRRPAYAMSFLIQSQCNWKSPTAYVRKPRLHWCSWQRPVIRGWGNAGSLPSSVPSVLLAPCLGREWVTHSLYRTRLTVTPPFGMKAMTEA